MDHVVCPSCHDDIVPREPERKAWHVIVAFWTFTLLFGIAAYVLPWTFPLIIAWLLLAMLGIQYGLRSKSWTCPRCDATVPSPHEAVV